MLKNYLKIAFRNIWKNRTLSIINILGLAISITVCFLIASFIINEVSFDKFHKNYKDLYRVVVRGTLAGQPLEYAVSMAALPAALKQDYPEIEAATMVFGGSDKSVLKFGDKQFFESSISSATPDFFKVFDYELLRGEKEQVLTEPNSIVLTKTLAKKYFHDDDPIGKTILLNDTQELTVTGVCTDIPTNSHLQLNALIHSPEVEDIPQNWGSFSGYNYIRLKEDTDSEAFESK
ncbi:MAG: ABC transporter permease, partial [Candidatus Cloacimonetes bacterium]|nr:ABC transporter permease [Candidatus Cloacimonadota bacterium]